MKFQHTTPAGTTGSVWLQQLLPSAATASATGAAGMVASAALRAAPLFSGELCFCELFAAGPRLHGLVAVK